MSHALGETWAHCEPLRNWLQKTIALSAQACIERCYSSSLSGVAKDCYADDWAIPDPMRVASVYLRQVQEGSAFWPQFMTATSHRLMCQ